MRQMGGAIKEMLDIDFGSTGADNPEPRSGCGGGCQGLQDIWTVPSVATLIKCVNDKDKSSTWAARKCKHEVKEESGCHVWVVAKVFCYNGSKSREGYCEFVD